MVEACEKPDRENELPRTVDHRGVIGLILVGRHLDAVARLTELVNQVVSICVEELSISGRSQERGFRTISERLQLGKQRRDSQPQDGARGPVGVPLLHILIELTGGVVLLL